VSVWGKAACVGHAASRGRTHRLKAQRPVSWADDDFFAHVVCMEEPHCTGLLRLRRFRDDELPNVAWPTGDNGNGAQRDAGNTVPLHGFSICGSQLNIVGAAMLRRARLGRTPQAAVQSARALTRGHPGSWVPCLVHTTLPYGARARL